MDVAAYYSTVMGGGAVALTFAALAIDATDAYFFNKKLKRAEEKVGEENMAEYLKTDTSVWPMHSGIGPFKKRAMKKAYDKYKLDF